MQAARDILWSAVLVAACGSPSPARGPQAAARSVPAVPAVCSADGWCWDNPQPQGHSFTGLAVISRGDAWAVGDGPALHWDGARWSIAGDGPTPVDANLWASSTDDVWTVTHGHAAHWDGRAWTTLAGPLVIGPIAGSRRGQPWTASYMKLLRWDGQLWSEHPGASNNLSAIWFRAPDDGWTAWQLPGPPFPGKSRLQHWDGKGLHDVVFPDHRNVVGFWGARANDVWAVARPARADDPGDAIYHWDGQSWQAIPVRGGSFLAIWGSSADDVWAVGSSIAHFDGHGWTARPERPRGPLTAVSGSSHDDVWAVGVRGAMMHFDGQHMVDLSRATDLGGESLWGTSANDLWAVGRQGRIAHRGPDGWSSSDSGTHRDLRAVWGAAADDVWAVGDRCILHHDGRRWSPAKDRSGASLCTDGPSPPVRFADIHGTDRRNVWAVGTHGAILHFDGEAWSPVASSTTDDLRAIWAAGADDLWLADERGRLWRRAGGSWTDSGEGAPEIQVLRGRAPDDLWAAGGPSVLHWDGQHWRKVHDSGYGSMWLTAIATTGHDDVWAASESAVLHWDGRTWNRSALDKTTSGRRSLWAGDHDLFTLDLSGTVLHRRVESDHARCPGPPAVAPSDCTADRWCNASPARPASPDAEQGFRAVACSDSVLWAVGPGGSVWQFDGERWRRLATPTKAALHTVWVNGPGDAWAAGGDDATGGVLLHWDGTSWTSRVGRIPGAIHAVWGHARDDVWAAGEHGVLLHFNGKDWATLDTHALFNHMGVSLTGVSGADSDVWFLENDGVVHFDGTLWTFHHRPENLDANSFTAMWVAGPHDVWLSNPWSREIVRFDGVHWSVAKKLDHQANAICGTGPDDVWIVGMGEHGNVDHFDGQAWATFSTGTGDLSGCTTSRGAFWAAGIAPQLLFRSLPVRGPKP